MIYGYIRVSTDKQTVENQRFEIKNFANRHGFVIDKWIEETISGTKKVSKRRLGLLLDRLKEDDILIASELSRLGRNLLQVMSILHFCLERGAKVWTIKDNYRLGDDIQSKVLAFAFSLSAEIERNLISQRTKEALARKRTEGVVLGRPKGSKSGHLKLSSKDKQVRELINSGCSFVQIAKLLKVHRNTVSRYVKENLVVTKRLDSRTKRENDEKLVM